MKPSVQDADFTLYNCDVLEGLAQLADGSVGAVVTDPPYGLGFMGKDWDSPGGLGDHPMRRSHPTNTVNTGVTRQGGRQRTCEDFTKRQLRDARAYQSWCEEWAAECLRVLQPGGFLLALGGTRTYHRLASAIEEAGFEVRDMIAWLYGQGFPKHKSLLKPALEPIVIGRKTGRGWLNTAACALEPGEGRSRNGENAAERRYKTTGATDFGMKPGQRGGSADGRWPANVALDEEAAAMLDEQSGILTSGSGPLIRKSDKFRNVYSAFKGQQQEVLPPGDSGGASRFFYVAKADQAERHEGLSRPSLFAPGAPERNDHPTVKPIALMRWLVPFLGSGTSAIAAALEGFPCIGIEADTHYADIARARVAHWTHSLIAKAAR